MQIDINAAITLICGLSAVAGVFYAAVKPFIKIRKDIAVLQRKADNDYEIQQDLKEFNRILQNRLSR